MCKVAVSDLKNSIIECIPPKQMGSIVLAEFDFKLIELGLNPKIPSVNQIYINVVIH